ncbi:MAG: YdhR family protein [Deltaproteobacteria bacterium]|nr:YdhR family protein [Deltaproteobacteria bacterium]
MITALVLFRVGEPVDLETARSNFSASAHKYQGVPGLIRKYFLVDEDRVSLGGVYLWRSKEDAERFFTDALIRSITEKYGSAPSITYFETPVVVDNRSEAGA